jgi:hypothetical protein
MTTKCYEIQERRAPDMEFFRVEVIPIGSNSLEINLYEHGDVKRYRSWKMPVTVAYCITAWWQEQGANRTPCVWKSLISINVPSPFSRHIDVKQLDALGRPKPAGWSLPIVVVEALTKELVNLEACPK